MRCQNDVSNMSCQSKRRPSFFSCHWGQSLVKWVQRGGACEPKTTGKAACVPAAAGLRLSGAGRAGFYTPGARRLRRGVPHVRQILGLPSGGREPGALPRPWPPGRPMKRSQSRQGAFCAPRGRRFSYCPAGAAHCAHPANTRQADPAVILTRCTPVWKATEST